MNSPLDKLICSIALSLILWLVFISGCATQYQPEAGYGFFKMEGGYFDKQVSDNEWFIGFRGNAKVDHEKARDYCLLRASEICLNEGFLSFFIVEELLDKNRARARRPSITRTQGDVYGRASNSTMTGPMGEKSTLVYKAHVRCSHTNEENAIDAQQLYNSILQQYNIRRRSQ